jgi:hypothetical protein
MGELINRSKPLTMAVVGVGAMAPHLKRTDEVGGSLTIKLSKYIFAGIKINEKKASGEKSRRETQ